MPGAQIFHLHIPKTAGTTLRSAFNRNGRKVLPIQSPFVFEAERHADVDLFSGHAGFRALEASPALRDRAVTILRDPYDRAVSYYYHLVKLHNEGAEVSERTQLAVKYDLFDFLALRDHPHLLGDLYNAATWQLVHDADLPERMKFRRAQPRLTDADLVERAKANLSTFWVVGLQSRMNVFADRLREATGFSAPLGAENVNPAREKLAAIDAETRRRLRGWVEMDVEVYEWALGRFGR